MKKWIMIRNITISLFAILAVVILIIGICILLDNSSGYNAIAGMSKLETFSLSAGFILIVSAAPLVISLTLLVISIVKLKNYKKHK